MTGWTLRSSPTAADLDGNGDLELLIGGDDDRLWAWHHDGSLVAGWPQTTNADLFSSPSVGDLDGDGDLEIASRFGRCQCVCLACGWDGAHELAEEDQPLCQRLHLHWPTLMMILNSKLLLVT